jgi:rhodanese-related sulfurtransferase
VTKRGPGVGSGPRFYDGTDKKILTKGKDLSYDKNMPLQFFGSSSDLNVTPQEVKSKLDRGDKIVLVDVREPWEFAINRLNGAIHVPLAELGRRFQELTPEAEIVCYCHVGVRSLKAAEFLKQQGYQNARNLAGGIDAWSVQIDPSVPRYR